MANIISIFKSTRLVYALWWLVWTILYAIILHRFGFEWEICIIDSLISNLLLGLICIGIGNIILYYQPSGKTAWKLIVWCLLSALFWNWLSSLILNMVLSGDEFYLESLRLSSPIRFAIGFMRIGCTLLIVWIIEFVSFQHEHSLRRASELSEAKDAELAGLVQQLQPHFLFNSLNSINALIGSRPQEARQMIQQLSDFLRGTLKKDDHKRSTLKEELDQLKLYLDIEKVRFGHRLKTEFLIEEKLEQLLLPALILQPLVENAIKFGLYDTTETVCIKLEAKLVANSLKIAIHNPYDPKTSANIKGTGFGLKSIKRRLFLIYARNDLMKTETMENEYISTISFPQKL